MSRTMQVGIHFANFTLPGGTESLGPILAGTAKAAEGAGCSLCTLMDHWLQMEQFLTAEDPMMDGYTSLGAIIIGSGGVATTLARIPAGATVQLILRGDSWITSISVES